MSSRFHKKNTADKDDGWTTVIPKRRGNYDTVSIVLNGRNAVAAPPVEEKVVLQKKAVHSGAASAAPSSSTSASSSSSAPPKRPATPPQRKVTAGTAGGKQVPEVDLNARVVSLFDRFLNTPTDTVVASYQIDGRRVNLYGLRESSDDMSRIEVTASHSKGIKFQSAREIKIYYGEMRREFRSINFTTYDAKSGKVGFYDNSDWESRAVHFNSNLRHWLESYETVLHNAQEVYMHLVGSYLRRPEAAVASDVRPSTALQMAKEGLPELPFWPRAAPEDLLGRLQWYMDRFVAPGNRQVLVEVIDCRLNCWGSGDCDTGDRQLLPSHLTKSANAVYTIIQPSAPAAVYSNKKEKMLENAVIEYHHNFKNLQADGSYEYWRDEHLNGELNNMYHNEDRSKYARRGNLYLLLNSPFDIVQMLKGYPY
jgi:hypothetical protein